MRLSGIATVMLLTGCATTGAPAIAAQENSLVAAGFSVLPADTPARQTALRRLPNRIFKRTRGTTVSYVYGDPVVCGCLYVGDAAAYGRYTSKLRSDNRAAIQLEDKEMPYEFEFL